MSNQIKVVFVCERFEKNSKNEMVKDIDMDFLVDFDDEKQLTEEIDWWKKFLEISDGKGGHWKCSRHYIKEGV